MPPMDMTPQDRKRLAKRLIREQNTRFSGVAKDAYIAAGVNSGTWKRAVEAETLKPHKLIQIVVRLWPETLGDWRKIPNLGPVEEGHLLQEAEQFREAVRAAREAGVEVLDEVRDILDSETG